MARQFDSKLVLTDGSWFPGYSFGADIIRAGELSVNTAMVGYQELISDPALTGHMMVMTYPLIGNYGVSDEDFETRNITIGGLIVREYNDFPSNFRYTRTLDEVLKENHVPGIEGIDTRMLTHVIQQNSNNNALICHIETPLSEALAQLAAYTVPSTTVPAVSCKKKWYARTSNHRFNVVVVDCGVRQSLLKALTSLSCNLTIVPYNTSAAEIEAMRPDGVLISNGPGSPADVRPTIELLQLLRHHYPLFGVGLGSQMIALAYGARIAKAPYRISGANHPVRNLLTNKIEIVEQGHIYCIEPDSLAAAGLEMTHIDLADGTLAGFCCRSDRTFGVQYHPESSDSSYLFNQFITLLEGGELYA